MFKPKPKAPNIKLFDSHCHLDFPVFDKDRNVIFDQMRKVGIEGVLIPGVQKDNWRFIRQLAAMRPEVSVALGLHPMFLKEHKKSHIHDLELAAGVKPLAAIGEIGLDFYEKNLDRKTQISLFKAQMEIAKSCRLPVVLHVRKAHEDVLLYLKTMKFQEGGIVHAFNGSMQQAERYRDFGFKLGFGGAMTYPRAVKLRDLAKNLPLTDIVLETDAPDMMPANCDHDHNSPLFIFNNFNTLVELRDEPASQIAEQTTANSRQVLRVS
ncbi:TatD family hydrolase [Kangiella sediminilitoris]|uniref:TatD-related deoxyribonuclease n=1 Tax=Kangiella sediminilitoris TaxID=1144748 RepID=A0A1B3B9D8_9GAMM|nr:TatD family hydrolase [Kangiella sediminilitoris]AOE49411.1 TatD-related deoxyribonuclease [Kangiella sediminilitoris]